MTAGGRHPFLRRRRLGGIAAACLTAAFALTARAQPETSAALIQLRVDQIHDGTPVTIAGDTLASAVVLPDFYERRGFQPAWTDPGARQDLLAGLRSCSSDGLDPRDYHLAAIEALLRAPSAPDADADFDLLATDAVIRLAYHLRFGKVDLATVEPDWQFSEDVEAAFREPPAVALQRAVDERKVAAGLDALRPTHWMYAALKRALQTYRDIEAAGGWKRVPEGPVLKPGASDPRLPALEARLAAEGDLAAKPRETVASYDSALVSAVRGFQAHHGLIPDGVLGVTTLRALNVPVATRINQLRISLERGRLHLHDLPERFVVVNIPGFRVLFVDQGRTQLVSRVVVGKPFTQTPIFRADMTYLVLNPTWTIPPGIMKRDVIPGMKKDPDYLEKKGYVKIEGQIVQPAGPDNALGRIKLMFPNPHHVYLHDTPQRDKFAAEARTFSNGCIRVEQVAELAVLALGDSAKWSREKLEAAISTGKTRNVTLERRLPVLLMYWTAVVDPGDDRARFFDDPYGRDPAFLAALDQPFHFHRARPVPTSMTVPGLSERTLAMALRAYDHARARGEVERPILSIIDYGLPSTEKRMWVLDLAQGRVLFHEWVAHGKKSGENDAHDFSNRPGSLQSSLGAFLTGDEYPGEHGPSLRLIGLEPGINDRAEQRAIVLHGASYVSEAFAASHGRIGRSFGCPAVREAIADSLIRAIRGGTLLFACAPDSAAMARSSCAAPADPPVGTPPSIPIQ